MHVINVLSTGLFPRQRDKKSAPPQAILKKGSNGHRRTDRRGCCSGFGGKILWCPNHCALYSLIGWLSRLRCMAGRLPVIVCIFFFSASLFYLLCERPLRHSFGSHFLFFFVCVSGALRSPFYKQVFTFLGTISFNQSLTHPELPTSAFF